jgi:hypothetical protein
MLRRDFARAERKRFQVQSESSALLPSSSFSIQSRPGYEPFDNAGDETKVAIATHMRKKKADFDALLSIALGGLPKGESHAA